MQIIAWNILAFVSLTSLTICVHSVWFCLMSLRNKNYVHISHNQQSLDFMFLFLVFINFFLCLFCLLNISWNWISIMLETLFVISTITMSSVTASDKLSNWVLKPPPVAQCVHSQPLPQKCIHTIFPDNQTYISYAISKEKIVHIAKTSFISNLF